MDLVNHLEDRLLFAVPKKGRLYESCVNVLKGADIKFRRNSRLDIALVQNFPIALVFLPAADIPRFVGTGRVHLGITGQDQIAEARLRIGEKLKVEELVDLQFGGCNLQVQVPENGPIQNAKQLVGQRIVTSFEYLVGDYFKKLEENMKKEGEISNETETEISFVSGSVEASCALGIAEAVVDLVESGETMRASGLKAIETIMSSSAVLVRSTNCAPELEPLLQTIITRIRGYVIAKQYVLVNYNVSRDHLTDVLKITPGKRAPTITTLDEPNWVAVSSMVLKKNVAKVMDELAQNHATDILVLSIDNSRP
ncbi:ATP phosphoribosyltransferase [Schizosaccharomyces cryophilus OY26]|uniref:ATP phosphoribosyltransferase n=1 Tax=Schizosaccharomyces cryophilus (strain OY26 / ATCC MYA-4695 / CBS 11777 / NBRC 106824 / NRRL Y48691) TaxID=653667 RepID=S9W1S3_SCHCR|nr:ATP phosphoribosyltransferase [Schizosaccharomyces cryophilus OY26]EPY51970.1 ATP phosphoribosyltransferase [Schizosaccharomyces cryophilus OY26]